MVQNEAHFKVPCLLYYAMNEDYILLNNIIRILVCFLFIKQNFIL